MTTHTYTPGQTEELCELIRETYGDGDYIAHETESEYVHTDVHISGGDELKSFVTFGMGAAKMNAPADFFERTELIMYTSPDIADVSPETFIVLNTLTNLSKFPFRNNTWLGIGHTVGLGDAFRNRFGYEYALLAPTSTSFFPKDTSGGIKQVNFLEIVPIYKDEREWIMKNNSFVYLDLLYNKFDIDMFKVDLRREHYIPSEDDLLRLEEEYED